MNVKIVLANLGLVALVFAATMFPEHSDTLYTLSIIAAYFVGRIHEYANYIDTED